MRPLVAKPLISAPHTRPCGARGPDLSANRTGLPTYMEESCTVGDMLLPREMISAGYHMSSLGPAWYASSFELGLGFRRLKSLDPSITDFRVVVASTLPLALILSQRNLIKTEEAKCRLVGLDLSNPLNSCPYVQSFGCKKGGRH
jgi:hypothetical protein